MTNFKQNIAFDKYGNFENLSEKEWPMLFTNEKYYANKLLKEEIVKKYENMQYILIIYGLFSERIC